MAMKSGLETLAEGAIAYPFARVRELLGPIEPARSDTIDLTLGEPRETMPAFIAEKNL